MNDDLDINRITELTLADRLLAQIGVRRVERSLVALLFGNMFLSGLATGIIRVCAFTLFLEHFASEDLALVAILLAVTGTILTLVLDRFTGGLSTRGYIYTVLGIVLIGIITMRVLLGTIASESLYFFLPLFFEVVYMLFNLQFVALQVRLLNVRQSKRLSALARSGEFMAEMVGGLSIAVLLNFMSVPDLLLIASISVLGVFVVVQITIKKFSSKLAYTTETEDQEVQNQRMMGMFRIPYVRMISFCYATYMFAYFFLDVAFYKYAAIQFPNERELATFIGQFFAISGFITMLTMVFIFAPFIRKFGMLAGVIAFPIVIAIGSVAVSMMEYSMMDAGLVFIVIVITNGFRFVLQSAIWRPSVSILFQVLPDKQRTVGTSLIEGVVDPFSGGLAGVCLYILFNILGWEPKQFLLVLAAMLVSWLIMGFFIRRRYISHLMEGIKKRKLGELSLAELDNDSLEIIMRGLHSDYPAEVFYCLNTLEELEHPDYINHLQYILENKSIVIRQDILQRIERLQITRLAPHIKLRIGREIPGPALGQTLRTYAALQLPDTLEQLLPFIKSSNQDVQLGALVGILTFDQSNEQAQDYLVNVVRSENTEDRIFAATVVGQIASDHFSGFLIELLDDQNSDVVDQAVIAAGQMNDSRLTSILIEKLNAPGLSGRAGVALQQIGIEALYELENALVSPGTTRQVREKIIEIIHEVPGERALEVLLRHIEITNPEHRHQIYIALANKGYQSDPDDYYRFVNMLNEEVSRLTWLLATLEELNLAPAYENIHSAMSYELDIHRDNMLLLTSFIFNSAVMLDTRANIDSKISDLRVFALEVLDNLLTAEIKQIVIPMLDELSAAERLSKLSERFPQQSLSANGRFDDIINNHFEEAFYWTRATLLYFIGTNKIEKHIGAVQSSLTHSEPVVRETALWALAQLSPADTKRTLTAHADDSSDDVRRVVAELLSNLAKPV